MPSFAEDLLKKAEEYLDKGEYKVAEGIAERFFHDVPEKDRSPALLVQAHLIAARALAFRAQHLEALEHCTAALRLAEKSGDVRAQAMTIRWAGYIHWRKGDYRKATEHAQEGMRKAVMAKDRALEGVFHVELGNALAGLGDPIKAEREFRVAAGVLEEFPGNKDLLRAYNNIGDLLKNVGKWEEANRFFQKVKALAGDNIRWIAWGGFNRAECLMEMGRLEDARKELDEAIPLIEKSGDKYGRAAAYKYLGLLNAKTKDWSNAKRNLEFARDLMKESGMPVPMARVLKEMGRMYMWKGETAQAKRCLEEARAIFKQHGSSDEVQRTDDILKMITK